MLGKVAEHVERLGPQGDFGVSAQQDAPREIECENI
jgi:hypothetical protein